MRINRLPKKAGANGLYTGSIKRFFDLSVALIALIIASPVLLVVVVGLAITNRGKVFFIQDRPGKREKIIKVIKFKTMNDLKDNKGELLPDEKRLNLLGSLVRKTSLDEMPQLLNVLKGDMSLVGPRPLLVEYLPLYTPEQTRRHEVRPGITGWAQVNGRNAINWEDKFNYDIWYVDHISFWLDIKIIFMTVLKVLKSEGISAQGQVTVHKFRGSDTNVQS